MLSFEEAQKKWLKETFPDREAIEAHWEPASRKKGYNTFGSHEYDEPGRLEVRFKGSWRSETYYVTYDKYLYDLLKAGME